MEPVTALLARISLCYAIGCCFSSGRWIATNYWPLNHWTFRLKRTYPRGHTNHRYQRHRAVPFSWADWHFLAPCRGSFFGHFRRASRSRWSTEPQLSQDCWSCLAGDLDADPAVASLHNSQNHVENAAAQKGTASFSCWDGWGAARSRRSLNWSQQCHPPRWQSRCHGEVELLRAVSLDVRCLPRLNSRDLTVPAPWIARDPRICFNNHKLVKHVFF